MKSILSYALNVIFIVLTVFGIQKSFASSVAGRAVVGIDYGTTNVRMGMLRSGVGSVEIVLSFESDRKTINAVAYRDDSTFFSQTAMNMFPKFPKAIFCRMNKLLGKLFNSPSVQEYRNAFVHEISEDPIRKTVLIPEPVEGKLVPIEEIAATFFTHLMDQAEQHAGFKVFDCVISVPSYFDQFERQAVLDAAKIAGFNVLSLINSVSAAALFKTTTANDITAPTNFIIYDSGSGGTSAALVQIDPKKTIDGLTAKSMEILGIESDSNLGGDLIDDRIASFLVSKFEALHPGIKVTPGKPYNKVLIESSRIKKILNANDRATVSLEDLVEDYGMNLPITREDIDNLLLDLAPRFSAPISNLLSQKKMSTNDISSILMIGGNSRHQFLLKTLKSQFGAEKLSVTLDPDESIVKGATLYGAKLHPAFRLRPTHFSDIGPSSIYLQYRENVEGQPDSDFKRVELFPEASPLQTRKSLTLKKNNNVLVDLFYGKDDRKIGTISILGFNKVVDDVASSGKHILSSKMRVPVFLSSSGQMIFEKPVAVVEFEETVSKKVYKTHTKTATATPTESITTSDTNTSTTKAEEGVTSTITPTATPSIDSPKPEISVETQTVQEKVKKTQNYDLLHEIMYEVSPMNQEAISKSQKTITLSREKEFENTRTATARNDLEKAVYRIQGELNSNEFLAYTGNSERSATKNLLSKVSKFLADEANESASAEVYLNHLQELVKIEVAVKKRIREEEERPGSIEALQLSLSSSEQFVNSQMLLSPDQRPQTDEDLNGLAKNIQDISKWLKEKIKKQSNTSKSVEPVLTLSELESKKLELDGQLLSLKSKKMPIKPKEPEQPPKNEQATENTIEQSAEGSVSSSNTNDSEKQASEKDSSEKQASEKESSEHPSEELVEERFEL